MTTKNRKRGRRPVDTEERRREILESAAVLFSRQGFSETSIQQIADSLQFAKGTIYLYFRNKEELYRESVELAIQRLVEHIDREVEGARSPIDQVRAIVTAFFHFIEKHRPLADILVHGGVKFKQHALSSYHRVYTQNSARLETIIGRGMTAGYFREVDQVKTADILAKLLSGTMYAYVLNGFAGDIEDEIETVTAFLLHNLRRNNLDDHNLHMKEQIA